MVLPNKIWSSDTQSIQFRSSSLSAKAKEPATTEEKINWKKKLWESFKNYSLSSPLHGCKYITTDAITREEQIFWRIIVLVAVAMSIVMVFVSYNWNSETPTVTTIESTHYTTVNLPFPAVTFCSINRISKQKAYQLARDMVKPIQITEDELAKLFLLAMDFSGSSRAEDSEYIKLGKILDANGLTGLMLLQKLIPSCEEMLVQCSWKGNRARCGRYFQEVNTTEGICCSFNYHGKSTHNFPETLSYSVPKTPYHINSCGYEGGLTVTLDPQIDDYFGTYLSSYGFRVMIHSSYDYPDANAETKVLPLNTENFIGILPQSSYASDPVAKMRPQDRNCLFHNERKLNVMRRYSYINCLAECRALLTYKLCGCTPLRYLNNGSFPSCRMEKIFCILDNINIFTGAIPGLNETVLRNHHGDPRPCNCLPDCENNFYPAEVASAPLDRPNTDDKFSTFGTVSLRNKVIAHVYFSDLVSTRYRKDIFQNWIQLLATFGGLLGLIMGFSFVAAFEFIYCIVVRPLFDYFASKFNSKQKSETLQPEYIFDYYKAQYE